MDKNNPVIYTGKPTAKDLMCAVLDEVLIFKKEVQATDKFNQKPEWRP